MGARRSTGCRRRSAPSTRVLRDDGAHGRATVTRGRNPIARLIGRIVGFPPEGEHELHVHFEEEDGVETWTRRFPARASTAACPCAGRCSPSGSGC